MKNKDFSVFYRKYLSVLIIILVAGLAAVWIVLSSFQNSSETKKAEQDWLKSQKCFEAYYSSMSTEDWVDLWYSTYPDSLDKREDVNNFVCSFLSEGLGFARAKTYLDETPVYVVEDSEQSIAEFKLSKDDSGEWKVVDSCFRVSGTESAELVVPSGCEVFCNGILLDDSYITSKEKLSFLKEYENNLTNPVELITWRVDKLIAEPELEVNAPDGTQIKENEEGQPVLIQSPADLDICKKADEFFDMFNKMGLYGYMYLSDNIRNTAALCKKDSQAYNLIIGSKDSLDLAPCHSLYETIKEMDDVIIWADNALSVDISYNTETTYAGNEKDYFDGEYRILLIDFGEGYEICGIVNQ